VTAFKAE